MPELTPKIPGRRRRRSLSHTRDVYVLPGQLDEIEQAPKFAELLDVLQATGPKDLGRRIPNLEKFAQSAALSVREDVVQLLELWRVPVERTSGRTPETVRYRVHPSSLPLVALARAFSVSPIPARLTSWDHSAPEQMERLLLLLIVAFLTKQVRLAGVLRILNDSSALLLKENTSYLAVAHMFGIDEDTVRKHAQIARCHMRSWLTDSQNSTPTSADAGKADPKRTPADQVPRSMSRTRKTRAQATSPIPPSKETSHEPRKKTRQDKNHADHVAIGTGTQADLFSGN